MQSFGDVFGIDPSVFSFEYNVESKILIMTLHRFDFSYLTNAVPDAFKKNIVIGFSMLIIDVKG